MLESGSSGSVRGASSNGRPYREPRVLCVKFCKRRSFELGLCGLADLGFLVFLEIVHVEVTVGLEPVLVGLDG
jgi:hypothetical protein